MKSFFSKTQLFLFLFNIAIFTTLKAQPNDHYSLGNDLSFFKNLIKKKSSEIKIHLKVNDTTSYPINLYTVKNNILIGEAKEKESFFKLIAYKNGDFEGHLIISIDKNIAYNLASDKNHNLIVSRTHVDNLICQLPTKKNQFHKEPTRIRREIINKYSDKDPLKMESRPKSLNVILVDIDGYSLPRGTPWNNGRTYEAAAIDWDDLKLKMLWAEVADKFAVFDVNVTTNEAVYQSAKNTNRQRLVVTPSVSFTGKRNYGIAYSNSFSQPNDIPCWVFMSYSNYTPDEAGDVGAHELGHTLGLGHQGTSATAYYLGHDHPSHDGWVPIMGFSNRRMIAQWSKSEFRGANANQDDLAKIAAKIPYIKDDHSDTMQNASQLVIDNVNGIIDGELTPNTGLINKRTDIDFFKFESLQGPIEITIKPRPMNKSGVINRSILDIEAKLYDQFGKIINTAETGHKNFLDGAVFSFTLPSNQTYYISVDGYGTGDPITGYSDYSSIGPYSISGSIPKNNLSIETNEKNNFTVYPIPAKDHLTIESKASQYKIINLLGQLVQEGKINSKKEFVKLTGVKNGFYLLKLFHENTVSTKSILIDK